MLKAFLGTLTLFFILAIYFLLGQKEGSSQHHGESLKSQNYVATNLKKDSKDSSSDSSVVQTKASTQVSRKISSEELMADFYKDTNNEKIKRANVESVFLQKYMRDTSDYYNKVQEEKWSAFRDIHVTLDKNSESLLPFGPYKITDKPVADMPRAQLLYNEDRKTFAILTGRLVTKLKNLFDEERISKDYGLKIDSVNADIKTVFYKMEQPAEISSVRKLLSQDSRIDSFYFETVHNQWQKN